MASTIGRREAVRSIAVVPDDQADRVVHEVIECSSCSTGGAVKLRADAEASVPVAELKTAVAHGPG